MFIMDGFQSSVCSKHDESYRPYHSTSILPQACRTCDAHCCGMNVASTAWSFSGAQLRERRVWLCSRSGGDGRNRMNTMRRFRYPYPS